MKINAKLETIPFYRNIANDVKIIYENEVIEKHIENENISFIEFSRNNPYLEIEKAVSNWCNENDIYIYWCEKSEKHSASVLAGIEALKNNKKYAMITIS